MNIPYVMRKCSVCGEWLVASTINFYRDKGGKYGLRGECKKCRNKYRKEYREANREKLSEYGKQYYKNNKGKLTNQRKQWYQDNRDEVLKYNKKYNKRYYKTPHGQVSRFNCNQRRRTKEEQQGTGITKDQWLEMMQYFDWKCAYSGEYIGGNDNSFNRTIDHIVPLNSNGDNMIWNCVPMLRNLNSSKHDKDMLTWYKTQECFDRERLDKIYQWQEYAFNKWYKEEE